MSKPLLIFVVALFLGAMFFFGEYPEYNPLKSDANISSDKVIQEHIKNSDKEMGEH